VLRRLGLIYESWRELCRHNVTASLRFPVLVLHRQALFSLAALCFGWT
jgi:hypothetical protein